MTDDWEPVKQSAQADDFQPVSTGKLGSEDTQTATVAQPPEPTHTAYLPDKGISVQHPVTMSHDQVNDAVQRNIYGRPQNVWFGERQVAETVGKAFTEGMGGIALDFGLETGQEPKAIPEIAKGAVRGAEAIPAQLGGLLEWFGQSQEDQGKALHNDIVRAIGAKTAEVGQVAREFWQSRQAEGWEAPDPEIFGGTFLSNPSFTRLAAGVAQNIPVLAAAALVSHAALAAGLSEGAAALYGAGGLGLLSGGDTYGSAKEHGEGNEKASILAVGSAVGNTVLMALPLGKVLSSSLTGKTVARKVAEGAFGFASASAVMVPFNNIIGKLGGDKARKLFDGFAEAILASAVTGGIMGGFQSGHGQMLDQLVQDAHNAGVGARDIDAARKAIADSMIANAALVEKSLEGIPAAKIQTKDKLQKLFDQFLDPKDMVQGSEQDVALIRKNIDTVMEAYNEATMKEYGTGRPVVSSSDLMKTMDLPFRAKFRSEDSVVRHAAAGAAAKIFDHFKLEDPDFKGSAVLVAAGVSGAGKTTVIKFAGINLDDYALVKYTNLSTVKSGKKMIDNATKTDHPVHVMLIDRDIIEAFVDGVFPRFLRRPEHRIIPIDVHLQNANAREVVPELAKSYPDVHFQVFRNITDKTPVEIGVEELRPLGYNLDEAKIELEGYLKARYEEGKGKDPFNEAAYETFLRGFGKADEQASSASLKPRQFFKNDPFQIRLGGDDSQTARNIREEYAGQKNEQITSVNQLSDEIKRLVPDKIERQGLFWYKAADGDMNKLVDTLDNPKYADYQNEILSALKMTDNQKAAVKLLNQYYTEAGEVSKDIGTIKAVRDNYMARLYAPEPPKDFVKNETQQGIKQTTSHAKHRVFDTEFEAVEAGKKFATTDVTEAMSIHGEEMARVNTARKMTEAMAEAGLGAWKKEAPDGWEKVGTLEKNVPIKDSKTGEAVLDEEGNQAISRSQFVAPKGIAEGLKAIADPNFAKKIDSVRNIQRYQGLVKTVDLSFSFFHHLTMAAQTLYQGGVRTLMHLPMMEHHLASPEFAEIEQDFTRNGGMTSKIQANLDILRNLTEKNPDLFSKIVNLPGPKQFLKTADASGEFLFGHIQRYLKTSDYGAKISKWIAKNPEATNEEVDTAKRGFAKEINAAYGGLNWEAMGMTKSNLSLLRLGLLAPDWTISNYELLKYAVSENPFDKTATAGHAARAHIMTALVGGMVLTEGLNKIITGHFTDKNKKGHKLEIEVQPNVYVSLLRGGIGDITKAGSMIAESGLAGASRFMQGKLAPFPRTAIGLLTNTMYTGQPIAKKGEGPILSTFDVLKYLLASAGPVPLGVGNLMRYMSDSERSFAGGAAIATGVGRYSVSGRKKQASGLL